MSESKGKVLIVDDQFLIVRYLQIWVESFGFDVCGTAKSADEAVEQALQHRPDAILMDVRLQGVKDGVDAANEIYPEHPCRMIYVTGSGEPSTIAKIRSNHPFEILLKPIAPADLGHALMAP